MYRILIDSCGELFPEMQNTESFCNVPLTLTVDSHEIIDDETFNQAESKKVRMRPSLPALLRMHICVRCVETGRASM